MIYAVSDIHGCYDKYQELLKAIHFSSDDTLYVLGDVIDRGPDGFKILLDMARRPNVVNLMGNHEAMAIDALSSMLCAVRHNGELVLGEEEAEAVELWFYNGGELSLADFLWLNEEESQTVWEYMQDLPLYKELIVNNRQFVLVHGGLENFSPDRPLDDYEPNEVLWCRPEADTTYYPDKYVVFGHTPVQILDTGNESIDAPAKIYRKGNLVDMDCGCVFPEGRLGCLCLDTMEEIYV
ncbi:MAG: serine/threonine protein phosphatase [Oscillibacter sp.]|nr:serine/threonine protein phosphatase [Oscillibacter sp.]